MDPPWGIDRISQRFMPLDGNYKWSFIDKAAHVYIADTRIREIPLEFQGRAQEGYNVFAKSSTILTTMGTGLTTLALRFVHMWASQKVLFFME